MSLGFDNIPDSTGGYLREAGLQTEATFVALKYVFDANWEGFDIELLTGDGKQFRERTFGANPEKVFPKPKWEGSKQVGMETKEEAYDRVQSEISKKLLHLAAAFVDKVTLKEKVKNVKDLKDFIDKINKALEGNTDKKVNFLAIWKNSEQKQRSNLIIADRTQWIEATKYTETGTMMKPAISLTNYQLVNGLKEKYPYNGGAEVVDTDASVVGADSSDLPF